MNHGTGMYAAWEVALDSLERKSRDQRYRDDPVAWVNDVLGESVWSKQAEIMRSVAVNPRTAVQSCHGIGKALAVDTPLPTPTGWTTMGKIQPGDQLLDARGLPCTVVAVSPEWDGRPCYSVHVDDGDVIVADAEHEWVAINAGRRVRSRGEVADWRDHWHRAETLSTGEMARRRHLGNGGGSNFSIPLTRPLDLPEAALPLPPYVVGAWLGDGCKDSASMTTCDQWMIDEFERQGMLVTLRAARSKDRSVDFGFRPDDGTGFTGRAQGGGKHALRQIGVLNNKHIPQAYLRGSREQRLELLRGLMDTDGFSQTRGNVAIEQRDRVIAEGVVELARSLGWRAHMSHQARPHPNRPGDIYRFWHVNFRPDVSPFKLPRKAAVFADRLRWDKRFTHRTVVRVEPAPAQTTRCVQVDSPSHLFLAGRGMVPTHNSHIASRLAVWWIAVHDPGEAFLVTTAPTSAQVRAILWRYIRQAHRTAGLPGEVMQTAEWKIDGELVGYGRKPADHQTSAFQGIHADRVLTILDEACGVPEHLFVAADALATNDASRTLAVGNPDDVSSHFARVCTTEHGWSRIKVSAYDSPNLSGEPVPEAMARRLVSASWVEDKRLRWGTESPLYVAKVLGEFVDSEDGLIPLSWVRAANQRWRAWRDRGSPEVGGRRIIGVDVARYGEDATVLAVREGDVIREINVHHKLDTTQTTSLVEAQLDFPASRAIVDVIGVGAGVVDQLRARRRPVEAFNGAAGTKRRDVTGSWRFPNVRSASWWNLRELLDPARGATLALPEDDELTAELVAPQWKVGSGNTLVVEPKDSMRKRIARSPDRADAVVMSVWTNAAGALDRSGDEPRPKPRAVRHEGSQFAGSLGSGAISW